MKRREVQISLTMPSFSPISTLRNPNCSFFSVSEDVLDDAVDKGRLLVNDPIRGAGARHRAGTFALRTTYQVREAMLSRQAGSAVLSSFIQDYQVPSRFLVINLAII